MRRIAWTDERMRGVEMLSKEDTELLTRVGPGTPCGDLLRRYWQPVAFVTELTAERPKKRMKVMGEELVIFRDAAAGYGLVGEHCSHRGTSLYYGFLEDGGLRCPYHGWLYDKHGHCLEQPFEPAQSMMKHAINHPAYPVQELAGMLFAYMGPPGTAPILPRWDILVREDGQRDFELHEILNCNWVQAEENTGDVTHTYFLHSYAFKMQGRPEVGAFFGRPMAQYGFQPFQWGMLKSWMYDEEKTKTGWGNLLIFPNMLRLSRLMHWRVPVDDTHTRIFWLNFPALTPGQIRCPDPVINSELPWTDERGEFTMDSFASQDAMAWETQGPVFDRSQEHLGASDRGVVLFREMLKEQILLLQRGGEPMARATDPSLNDIVDMRPWLTESDYDLGAAPAEAIFDERHEIVDVPFGKARPPRAALGVSH